MTNQTITSKTVNPRGIPGCGHGEGSECQQPILPDPDYQANSRSTSVIDFRGFWQYFWSMPELKWVIPGLLLLVVTLFMGSWGVHPTVVLVVQLLLLPIAGWSVISNGFTSLFKERELNMNVLMSIAIIGATFIGEIHEALIMLFLFTISESLEGYTTANARRVLSEFADLAPRQALRIGLTGEELVPIESLAVGDLIVVRPGDRFPMDGVIQQGASDVNQAPITGESTLVGKSVGDIVLSGTVNGQGLLEVEVTHLAADTTMQRIITLVTEAQSTKAVQQKFIDRFASVYTPIVVVVALLVAVIPTVFFDQPLWNTAAQYGWIHRSLSILLIGCPCALVISTPITMISGLTRAARSGVVFKGGVFLEGLSRAKVFAFDKTGTLTRGQPAVSQVSSVDCVAPGGCEQCDDMLAIASSLEEHTSHPLSHAVLEEANERGVLHRYAPAEALTVLEGKGQQGVVNGKLATVGSLKLFLEEHDTSPELANAAMQAERAGKTTILVCDGDRVRGYLSLEDEVRPESADIIAQLNDSGFHTVMLTGDNQGSADRVAEKVGIRETHASLLPEQKLELLNELQKQHGYTVMVGDGINDSPALAKADLGVAMGGAGNAQVLETADVVLMNNDLSKLPFAVRLSRFTNLLIRQNIVVSLGIKFVVAALAIFGLTPLWVAVMSDIGVSLIVTLNGYRAAKFESKPAR